jgi:hypothetical protein
MFASLLKKSLPRILPTYNAVIAGLRRGVLEFLGDEETRDLRAGAVLPDEVYLL